MTAFLAWWVETDALLEAQGHALLSYGEAKDLYEAEVPPETVVEIRTANAKWAAKRKAKSSHDL
jgi:hypothetical protein